MTSNLRTKLTDIAEAATKAVAAGTAVLYGLGLAVAAIHAAAGGLEFPALASTRYPLIGFWLLVHAVPGGLAVVLAFPDAVQKQINRLDSKAPRHHRVGVVLAHFVILGLAWVVTYGLVLPGLLLIRDPGPYRQWGSALLISSMVGLLWHRTQLAVEGGSEAWRGAQPVLIAALAVGCMTLFTNTFFRQIPLGLAGGAARDAQLVLSAEARERLVAANVVPAAAFPLSVLIADESGDRIAFRLKVSSRGLRIDSLGPSLSRAASGSSRRSLPVGPLIIVGRSDVVAIVSSIPGEAP